MCGLVPFLINGHMVGSCDHSDETSDFYTLPRIIRLADQLLVSQE
jgi:hypothetical protein